MATVKNRKTAGKQPARSDAEWWDQRRVGAFEALRGGSSLAAAAVLAGVNTRTLQDWQSDARWQARLADRDRAAAEQAQATELAPLAALQSQVVAVVAELLRIALRAESEGVRVSACKDILDRLNVRAVADENQGLTERFMRALCLDATLQRAQRLVLPAMRGDS